MIAEFLKNMPARMFSAGLTVLAACAVSATVQAATYYVDPATGSMSNPGTAASPWSTLADVFGTANKKFVGGDVILLRSGYHGFPTVRGTNHTSMVTIQPDVGAAPKLREIRVQNPTGNWIFSGLDICPENYAPGTNDNGVNLVFIEVGTHDITITNCLIRRAFSVAGFSMTDWTNRMGGGSIISSAPNSRIINNIITNAGYGIQINKLATNSVISQNTIRNFRDDGIRGLADDCVYEYNTVENAYVGSANHDDFFQSWSQGGANGTTVGLGTIYRVTVRGNRFISQTDPNQPFVSPPQGIGCFDGMYQDWVVENNLIVTASYHGISFYGAINCRIVNNTVVENLFSATTNSAKPWIYITEQKATGYTFPPSTNNLARNNISSSAVGAAGTTIDHNIVTANYAQYAACFVNPAGLDYALLPTSLATKTGNQTNAPAIDILQRARSLPYDIGAYAYVTNLSLVMTTSSPLATGTAGVAYSQILAATGGTPPYLWALASGGLPAGLVLSNTTATISGVPTTATNQNIQVKVTDSVGTAVTNTFNLVIALAPLLTNTTVTPLSTGMIGSAYSQTLTAYGGIMPYAWALASGGLPTGLVLATNTGIISGTPTTATNQNIQVKVTDSVGTAVTNTFNLVIVPVPLLTNTTASPLSNGFLGLAYSQTLTASGGTAPYTWALISGGLPAGLTLTASSGAITGTPTAITITNFQIRLADSAGAKVTNAFSLTINAPPNYFTEEFNGSGTNDFDLAYKSLAFTPTGSTNYTACLKSITSLPDPTNGTALAAVLGDDNFTSVNLVAGAKVYLYETPYTNFYINANGNITFGSSDTSYPGDLTNHFALPRIAMLWRDLNPGGAGGAGAVTRTQLTDRVVVTFSGVREYASSAPYKTNTFQCTQYFDGRIVLSWLQMDSTTSLVGLSRGLGRPANFVKSDLSTTPVCLLPTVTNTFVTATGGFAYTVSGSAGQPFVVWSSGDLKTWSPLLTNPLTQGYVVLTNAILPSVTNRFYWVKPWP